MRGEKKTFRLENSSQRNSKCRKEHTGPIFFFFLILFASQCITHIWVATERLRLFMDHHYQRQKNVTLVKWGPGKMKSQAELLEESPWIWPPIQAREMEPDHESISVWMHTSLQQRTACRNRDFVVNDFPSFLSPSTCPLLDQIYKVRQDKLLSFDLLVSWRMCITILSLKWRIYSFLPVV